MITKISVIIVGLLVLGPLNLHAFNNTGDEEKIKAVIIQAFLTDFSARAQSVEYKGQVIPGKERKAATDELANYVSDKKGYLSKIKDLLGVKEGNERMFFARVSKRRLKDLDFKSIMVNGDAATVEVDVYTEATTHMGVSTVVIFHSDQRGNTIGSDTIENKEEEIVTPGGKKHFISLERIENKWHIVWDDYDFLPGYRP